MTDAFHPSLRHIAADQLDPDTAQSTGMRRFAAISNKQVGSEKLWMGQAHVEPGLRSADHHHGEAETAIFVVSGTPEFVFLDGDDERRIKAQPGDYVFVPPWVPHREENNDPRHRGRRRGRAQHPGGDRRQPPVAARRRPRGSVDVGKTEFAFSVTDSVRSLLLKPRTGCSMTGPVAGAGRRRYQQGPARRGEGEGRD